MNKTLGGTKLSVLLPVFNGQRFLREAIESILHQSYETFELIVVDDGSKDDSAAIVLSYGDRRIRLLSNENNIGLIASLNRGIDESYGEYIARMDADDRSGPERFAKQIEFLDRNPSVAMVGTWGRCIDSNGQVFDDIQLPVEPLRIEDSLLSGNCFIHTSVMFRRSLVREAGNYSEEAVFAEDYDLWLRLSEKYPLANIGEFLVEYRIHEDQLSLKMLKKQMASALRSRNAAVTRRRADSKIGHPDQNTEHVVAPPAASVAGQLLAWSAKYSKIGNKRMARKLLLMAWLSDPLMPADAIADSLEPVIGRKRVASLKWYLKRVAALVRRRPSGT